MESKLAEKKQFLRPRGKIEVKNNSKPVNGVELPQTSPGRTLTGVLKFAGSIVVVAMTLTSFGSSNDILGFFDKLGNLEYDFLALLNSILAKTDVILVELDLIGMF